MTLRKTTSLTTLVAFILLLSTSIILYVTPQGKIAYWANWKMLGLGKEQWSALHTNLGFLFLISGIIHIVLNWQPITAYLKNRAQQLKVFTADFNLAVGICLALVLFTLLEWQPIHAIQVVNENLKDAAAKEYGEPPYGHAEASPLKSLCKKTGLDFGEVVEKLQAGGLAGVAAESTLAQIAAANGMTPQQVYELIQPEPAAEMPDNPGSGFGRKVFSEVCTSYGLETAAMLKGLGELGIKIVDPEATMKQIAENNGMDPHGIYEAMLQLQ